MKSRFERLADWLMSTPSNIRMPVRWVPKNVCLQAIRELQIDKFLQRRGWSERKIQSTLSSLIIRTVYASSETEILAFNGSKFCCHGTADRQFRRLPDAVLKRMQQLLSRTRDEGRIRTSPLPQNRLVVQSDESVSCSSDLTNFYFEGSKRQSAKAKFGRSKEKRSDCKLLVLALAINTEGFIRYSSILEGNTTDPQFVP